MKINLGENIKKLRLEHNLTQENLADFLGVSFQAVSKWERGDTVPDVYMLPVIASFFNVTTDNLLNFDRFQFERDVEEYERRYYELWQSNKLEELLNLMKEAVRTYPSEYRLLVRYLNVIVQLSSDSHQMTLDVKNEVISIYERIQNHCTKDNIRMWAKKIMFNYLMRLSKIESSGVTIKNAEDILQDMPLMQNSRDYLSCYLYKGDALDHACKSALSEIMFLFNCAIRENWIYNKSQPLNERIEVILQMVNLNKIVYTDGNYGKNYINMALAAACLCRLYRIAGNDTQMEKWQSESTEIADRFDSLDGKLKHSSLLLNGIEQDKLKIPGAFKGSLKAIIQEYINN